MGVRLLQQIKPMLLLMGAHRQDKSAKVDFLFEKRVRDVPRVPSGATCRLSPMIAAWGTEWRLGAVTYPAMEVKQDQRKLLNALHSMTIQGAKPRCNRAVSEKCDAPEVVPSYNFFALYEHHSTSKCNFGASETAMKNS